MLAKRIIPCLDIKDGRVVKGVNFLNLQDAGDPLNLAQYYDAEKADELVFLDISATNEARKLKLKLAQTLAREIFIPFTIGGGINNLPDIIEIIQQGADKIALNSAAIKNPQLITQTAKELGSQCVVVAIDVKKIGTNWLVFTQAGTYNTGLDAIQWAKKVYELGAGEIILTSMDKDGTKSGFDLEITAKISQAVRIPVIASGGASQPEDFYQAFTTGHADGALAASIFHRKEVLIKQVKAYLNQKGIPIRD